MRTAKQAIMATVVLTAITGLVYPLVLCGLAHVLFPWRASGSLIVRDGRVIGSALIGQKFTASGYFHGRPSAAGAQGYDAANSGGSNLGPTNKALIGAVRSRLKAVLEASPGVSASQVPVDLVTASGSGLDPDISPAAAELQVARVAKARGMGDEAALRRLVRANTQGRWAGIFGEPRVNVLSLNLALDRLDRKGRPGSTGLGGER